MCNKIFLLFRYYNKIFHLAATPDSLKIFKIIVFFSLRSQLNIICIQVFICKIVFRLTRIRLIRLSLGTTYRISSGYYCIYIRKNKRKKILKFSSIQLDILTFSFLIERKKRKRPRKKSHATLFIQISLICSISPTYPIRS